MLALLARHGHAWSMSGVDLRHVWRQPKGYAPAELCLVCSPSQRTWQIWSFAFAFAVRYFALKLRFTYGRAGMTPEAVISRRSKLAAWLREGLVKLGPTFIKIGERGLGLVTCCHQHPLQALQACRSS